MATAVTLNPGSRIASPASFYLWLPYYLAFLDGRPFSDIAATVGLPARHVQYVLGRWVRAHLRRMERDLGLGRALTVHRDNRDRICGWLEQQARFDHFDQDEPPPVGGRSLAARAERHACLIASLIALNEGLRRSIDADPWSGLTPKSISWLLQRGVTGPAQLTAFVEKHAGLPFSEDLTYPLARNILRAHNRTVDAPEKRIPMESTHYLAAKAREARAARKYMEGYRRKAERLKQFAQTERQCLLDEVRKVRAGVPIDEEGIYMLSTGDIVAFREMVKGTSVTGAEAARCRATRSAAARISLHRHSNTGEQQLMHALVDFLRINGSANTSEWEVCKRILEELKGNGSLANQANRLHLQNVIKRYEPCVYLTPPANRIVLHALAHKGYLTDVVPEPGRLRPILAVQDIIDALDQISTVSERVAVRRVILRWLLSYDPEWPTLSQPSEQTAPPGTRTKSIPSRP